MTATFRFNALLVGGLLLALPVVATGQDKAQQRSPQSQPAPAPAPPPRVAPPPPPSPPPAAVARTAPPSPPVRFTPPPHAVSREGAMPRSTLPSPVSANPTAAAAMQERAHPRGTSTAQPTGVRAVPRESVVTPRSSPAGAERVGTASERPRGDRPSYGTAVARQYPPHHGGGGHYPWDSPWWWNTYPYSFGFFAWDPYWWGATYPVYSGYPVYAPPATSYFFGGVRLKVKPKDASVFVDGYFAGTVDNYDGAFQKLELATGPHHIQIQAPGYVPLDFDVNIQVDQTFTYKAELQRQ
jgi:hypothetical protein